MRVFLRPHEAAPPPEPLRTDDRAAVLVGTAGWLVLLVVGLAVPSVGSERWTGACVAGVVLGFVALAYLHRRDRAERRDRRG